MTEVDIHVEKVTGKDIEAASAAELRQAAEALVAGARHDVPGRDDQAGPRLRRVPAAEPAGRAGLVGGRRLPVALGFRLDGAWAATSTDTWGAIRGTAIHKYLETSSRTARVPHRGRHALPGHPRPRRPGRDRDVRVTDWKTTKLANAKLWQEKPRCCGRSASRPTAMPPGSSTPANCPSDCHGADRW